MAQLMLHFLIVTLTSHMYSLVKIAWLTLKAITVDTSMSGQLFEMEHI